ncbi:MAG: VOC family protein [Oscillospiraceae bacterium]|nr:VOC family protein [Oscillospiraceae bacterium]
MKYNCPMIVVSDMEKTVEFYKNVLGLDVIQDFGANKTLTGGISLQTEESYKEFIGKDKISYGGDNFELYFEEDEIDAFFENLKEFNVELVHPVQEHSWGQRAVRIYDPDRNIIEVGESLQAVCARFSESGMNANEIAERMDVPTEMVENWLFDLDRR